MWLSVIKNCSPETGQENIGLSRGTRGLRTLCSIRFAFHLYISLNVVCTKYIVCSRFNVLNLWLLGISLICLLIYIRTSIGLLYDRWFASVVCLFSCVYRCVVFVVVFAWASVERCLVSRNRTGDSAGRSCKWSAGVSAALAIRMHYSPWRIVP